MIYHITIPEHYEKFTGKEYYESPSLLSESFIHCSTLVQLRATTERFYKNVSEILILVIGEQKLTSELKYELAKIGEEFPHIYGRINKEAIIEIRNYKKKNGEFEL